MEDWCTRALRPRWHILVQLLGLIEALIQSVPNILIVPSCTVAIVLTSDVFPVFQLSDAFVRGDTRGQVSSSDLRNRILLRGSRQNR